MPGGGGDDRGKRPQAADDAIEPGDHPSWTLKMQVMPFEEAEKGGGRPD